MEEQLLRRTSYKETYNREDFKSSIEEYEMNPLNTTYNPIYEKNSMIIIEQNDIQKILAKLKTNLEKVSRNSIVNLNKNIPHLNEDDFLSLLDGLYSFLSAETSDLHRVVSVKGLYEVLKKLELQFYSNSNILIKINNICATVIKNIKESYLIKRFLDLIIESTKYHDVKSNMLVNALDFIFSVLDNNSYFIDLVYDTIKINIFNTLNVSKNINVQVSCYKILSLFSENNVFSFDLVNKGLLSHIKATLLAAEESNKNLKNNQNNNDTNNNNQDNTQYFNMRGPIISLITDLSYIETNKTKISEELMEYILLDYKNENKKKSVPEIVKEIELFELLFVNPSSIDPFVKFGGIEIIFKILSDESNSTNFNFILKLFHILNVICNEKNQYCEIMNKNNGVEIIQKLIDQEKDVDQEEKKIEFEGKTLIFWINEAKNKLEEVEDVDYKNVNYSKTLKPEVKNFLTSGRQVKVINNLGEINSKQLLFSNGYYKVMAKDVKSDLAPKSKYIVETANIRKIVKGYGTDVFLKSKGLFRSAPNEEQCFSIIGKKGKNGLESLNIVCKTEDEVDKWINNIEELIKYLQKNNRIKVNIEIIKEKNGNSSNEGKK